jgi:dihydrofolate reductase
VEQALERLAVADGDVAIIGGTDVFGLFLPRYDVFHLTRVPGVTLAGGRPVFPAVPAQTPEAVLTGAGLVAGPAELLDAERGVSVVSWERGPVAQ